MPACSSFGYLGLPDGFCSSQGACHQFAIALGELGSGLYTDADISFMLDLGMYLHNLGTASQSEPACVCPCVALKLTREGDSCLHHATKHSWPAGTLCLQVQQRMGGTTVSAAGATGCAPNSCQG